MSRKSFVVCALVIVAMIAHLAMGSPKKDKQKKSKAGRGVAVVDMKRLFEAHPSMRTTLAGIKAEVEIVAEGLKQQAAKIDADQKRLKTLDPDSEEYELLGSEILNLQAKTKLKMDRQKRSFKNREATLMSDTYDEIQALVAMYAREHQIALVLRSHRSEESKKDPEKVLQRVNGPIVFQDDIDITDDIVGMLKSEL